MVGVEFVIPNSRTPDADKTKKVQKACLEEGLVLLTCGTYDNIIRWIPSLIIKDKELEEALNIFNKVMERIG